MVGVVIDESLGGSLGGSLGLGLGFPGNVDWFTTPSPRNTGGGGR